MRINGSLNYSIYGVSDGCWARVWAQGSIVSGTLVRKYADQGRLLYQDRSQNFRFPSWTLFVNLICTGYATPECTECEGSNVLLYGH